MKYIYHMAEKEAFLEHINIFGVLSQNIWNI